MVRIGNWLSTFLEMWKKNCKRVEPMKGGVKSFDITAILKGLETLLIYHVATEGHK